MSWLLQSRQASFRDNHNLTDDSLLHPVSGSSACIKQSVAEKPGIQAKSQQVTTKD